MTRSLSPCSHTKPHAMHQAQARADKDGILEAWGWLLAATRLSRTVATPCRPSPSSRKGPSTCHPLRLYTLRPCPRLRTLSVVLEALRRELSSPAGTKKEGPFPPASSWHRDASARSSSLHNGPRCSADTDVREHEESCRTDAQMPDSMMHARQGARRVVGERISEPWRRRQRLRGRGRFERWPCPACSPRLPHHPR